MVVTQTNKTALDRLINMVDTSDVCILITTDIDGHRHNRPMAAVKFDDKGDCWFFASKSSGKLQDISHNNKLQVVFANPATDQYLEVQGTGSITCDENEIKHKWSPLVSQWFPNGVNDPELCMVKVEVTNIFYWDEVTEGIKRLAIKTTIIVEEQKLAA